MKSPNTSIPDNFPFLPRRLLGGGFTLIETLIVIGIIGFVAVVGVIIGIDTYQRYNIRSDLDRAAVLLQKARSSAINNVSEISHGVYLGDSGAFILFRGINYAGRLPQFDLRIDKNPVVTITPPASEIVFAPLSGASSNSTLTVSDGVRSLTIEINNEGRINW